MDYKKTGAITQKFGFSTLSMLKYGYKKESHFTNNFLTVNVNIKLDRKFFSKNLRGTTKNFPSHFFETNQLNRHVEKTDILVKGLNKVSLD